jgi:uncharacterized sporulation protein YeaH/YhbH (DUF444 family)
MTNDITISAATSWYDLFSRGARDWLRHNEKVRKSVREQLPDLIAGTQLSPAAEQQAIEVPVQLLEHARFKLSRATPEPPKTAGQGKGKAGDLIRSVRQRGDNRGDGGKEEGEVRLMVELKIEDLIDWLWEELQLPDLKPRQTHTLRSDDVRREGWDRHGARARLDRRRTVKEAIKRRAIQPGGATFINEDLRFRQLVHRDTPATSAVVIFALDVSASMTEAERKLAKSFFFMALQGLRRKYTKVETRFIAHTTQAWEFPEHEFFEVTGTGGTGASAAFRLAAQMLEYEYPASQYNAYLFYASDGENFTEDRGPATDSLASLARGMNYIAYAETVPGSPRSVETEMRFICNQLERDGAPLSSCTLTKPEDVWQAIRRFLIQEAQESEIA